MMLPLFLASLQAAAPAVPTSYACQLTNPQGDMIDFGIGSLSAADTELQLFGSEGTVWPNRTLPAARGAVGPEPGKRRWFAMGGKDGLVLELPATPLAAGMQAATLFARKGRGVSFPVAYGFCAPMPADATVVYPVIDASADPRAIGQDLPAFDPRHWPASDCALILSDGRRSPFRFSLKDRDHAELAAAGLWSGHPQLVQVKWGSGEGSQSGTWRRGALSGFQVMYVSGSAAAKLVRFQDAEVSGYAICGYNDVVRRAVTE
jgi:hypothetical protein